MLLCIVYFLIPNLFAQNSGIFFKGDAVHIGVKKYTSQEFKRAIPVNKYLQRKNTF